MKHGAYSAYNYGCRCEDCRAAHYKRMQRVKKELHERLAELPPERHGKASTYCNYGCRCGPCVAANAIRCADYDRRRKANGGRRLTNNYYERGHKPLKVEVQVALPKAQEQRTESLEADNDA